MRGGEKRTDFGLQFFFLEMQKFQENCTAASFTEETENNKVTEYSTKLRLKFVSASQGDAFSMQKGSKQSRTHSS